LIVLVSVVHPAAATDTAILCWPGLMLRNSIGVTLPVSTPSIQTFAPSGNEVTTTSVTVIRRNGLPAGRAGEKKPSQDEEDDNTEPERNVVQFNILAVMRNPWTAVLPEADPTVKPEWQFVA